MSSPADIDTLLRSTCTVCQTALREAQRSHDIVYVKDIEGNEISIGYVGDSAIEGCPLCRLFLAATVSEQPLDPKEVEVDNQIAHLKATYKGLEVGFGVQFYTPSPSDMYKLDTPSRMKIVAHLVEENGEGTAYTRNFVIQTSPGKYECPDKLQG